MPNPRNRPRAGNALVGIITCPKYRISDGLAAVAWSVTGSSRRRALSVNQRRNRAAGQCRSAVRRENRAGSISTQMRAAADHGAELVTPPYPEGTLSIATIRDPVGNVIGVWQDGPR